MKKRTFVIFYFSLMVRGIKKNCPGLIPEQLRIYLKDCLLIFFISVSNPAFIFNKGFFKSLKLERVAF